MILLTHYKVSPIFRDSYVYLTCQRRSRLLPAVLFLACGIFLINACAQSPSRTGSSTQPRTGSNNAEATTGSIQKDWKTVAVPPADLTMSLPNDLSEETPSSEPEKNGNVTWTHYSYEWKTEAGKPEAGKPDLRISVYVFVTNWDNDFPPEAGGGTPDAILERSYITTERHKNSGEIEELRYLELDGVKGLFLRAPKPQDKNRINLVWETVRYHKNKAQKLSISISGGRSDLERLMKLIDSVRLAQK